MPVLRKMEESEVKALENDGGNVRDAIAKEYDAYLSDFVPGDWGEAELGDGENKLNVRNRLKAAAARRGWSLEFPRTRGNTVRFRIVGEGDEATEVFGPAQEELELVA